MTGVADLNMPTLPVSKRGWAVFAAFGLATGGFLAGFAGMFVTSSLITALGVVEVEAIRYLAGNQIQVGFALFAAAYLYTRDDRQGFVRVRVPSAEGVAWMVLGTPVVIYLLAGLHMITTGAPGGAAASGGSQLTADLHLLPVALVGQLLFAAPAEEMVYRGIVHGRLRETFDTPGIVVIGGLAFGFLHLLIGLVTLSVSLTGAVLWFVSSAIAGFVWGLAYERTENIVVPTVLHFARWTVPFGTILPFV
ncbi:MAG: CAAX protease self-immunity [uncultured archaeon A07HN63]|jgi:CAAX amino terminal protease family.|nr:MAG: CAAX protease self-immunity [uncultured archaeon A07HN63]